MVNEDWRTAPSQKLDLSHAATAQSVLEDAMLQALVENPDKPINHIVVNMRDVVNMRKYCREIFDPEESPDRTRQGIMGYVAGASVLVTPELQPGDVRFVMDK